MCYHLTGYLYDVRYRAVGSYAVNLFFVLSGFAMTWVYAGRAERFPTGEFYVARAARIVPMWWAATIATIALSLPDWPGLGPTVENLTFLSALTPTRDIVLGGWSIEIEVLFYLLCPVILTTLRSERAWIGLFVVALAVRLIYTPSAWARAGDELPVQARFLQMPNFLVFFVGGMIAARVRASEPSARGRALATGGLVLIVGVLSLNFVSFRSLQTGPLALVLTLSCVVGVALVSYAPNPTSRAMRWTFAALGAVSYGTYLLHPLVFTVVRKAQLGTTGTFAVTSVLTPALAWASYRWFERPVAMWVRTRSRASAAIARSGSI